MGGTTSPQPCSNKMGAVVGSPGDGRQRKRRELPALQLKAWACLLVCSPRGAWWRVWQPQKPQVFRWSPQRFPPG